MGLVDTSLQATKRRVPPATRHLVYRARLVDALERGVQDDGYKLILLSAPAGYGKTTLLAQWAQTTPARVVWLSLGKEDNDVDRLFRSLLASWDVAHPGVRESALGLLLGDIEPDREAVLAAFIDAANDIPDHTVFVLDDAHLIAEPSVHEALTYLIDHLPPTLHVVLSGRAEPPLPLARYRARRELMELRTDELRFLAEETAEFLHRMPELDLAADTIGLLHDRLEGWAAGLHLLSLTLRWRGETDPLVVSGRHRFIADYLSDDVLAHLPETMRRFLLQTSILDRLCGALCDAVTGTGDGQEMLELLERENLFLVPLDDTRQWFRYHRLFADFLRAELHRRYADEVRELHRRAAQWYLDQNLADESFQHAVAGDALDLGAQIIDCFLSEKLHGGELRLVQGWLAAIPASWLATYPLFGLAQAGVLLFFGELDASGRCVDDVERKLASVASDETRWQQAQVTAYRCFEACFRNDLVRAERHAAAALRNLREEDVPVRIDIHHALGDTFRGHGRWTQAREHYLLALDLSQRPADGVRAAHIYGALADLDLRQGRLRDAEASWRKALATVQEPANWGHLPLPVIGWVYLRLSEVLYERDELAQVWDLLAQGLERAELGGDVRALMAGSIIASRYTLTEGDVEAAEAYLERARPFAEQASFPDWTSRFERSQLELWLAQNKLRTAIDWAEMRQRDSALMERSESEPTQLALARVLVVHREPSSRERALTLLDRLFHAAEEEGRLGVQIEALALRALALWQGGDRAGAMVALERALRQAEPQGYVRLFADLGLPMARLLQEARARKVMPDYVARLIAACRADAGALAAADTAVPEPLSEREREVLPLLAAGLTNREIAAALFVTAETVKKHIGNIFAKLGVSNRTEAAARARAFDLLD